VPRFIDECRRAERTDRTYYRYFCGRRLDVGTGGRDVGVRTRGGEMQSWSPVQAGAAHIF